MGLARINFATLLRVPAACAAHQLRRVGLLCLPSLNSMCLLLRCRDFFLTAIAEALNGKHAQVGRAPCKPFTTPTPHAQSSAKFSYA